MNIISEISTKLYSSNFVLKFFKVSDMAKKKDCDRPSKFLITSLLRLIYYFVEIPNKISERGRVYVAPTPTLNTLNPWIFS